jgi:hypothetical protein
MLRRRAAAASGYGAGGDKIRCVVADGRELPFRDTEFDVSFSNAVVEHVGGRGPAGVRPRALPQARKHAVTQARRSAGAG